MRQLTWLALLGVGLMGACVPIEGGAVEARWVLRTSEGIAVDCGDMRARIGQVRLLLAREPGGDDPCVADSRCLFDCTRGVGTTPFFIPEGRYAMWLQPLDGGGAALNEADGVTVPAPLVQHVRRGEATSLFVNLFIVDR